MDFLGLLFGWDVPTLLKPHIFLQTADSNLPLSFILAILGLPHSMSLELQWPCHSNGFFSTWGLLRRPPWRLPSLIMPVYVDPSSEKRQVGMDGNGIQQNSSKMTRPAWQQYILQGTRLVSHKLPLLPSIEHWIHSYIETFYPTHDTWRLKSEPVTVHLWQIFLNVIATNQSESLRFFGPFLDFLASMFHSPVNCERRKGLPASASMEASSFLSC